MNQWDGRRVNKETYRTTRRWTVLGAWNAKNPELGEGIVSRYRVTTGGSLANISGKDAKIERGTMWTFLNRPPYLFECLRLHFWTVSRCLALRPTWNEVKRDTSWSSIWSIATLLRSSWAGTSRFFLWKTETTIIEGRRFYSSTG